MAYVGEAKVTEVFKLPSKTVAGCVVMNGKIQASHTEVKLIRNHIIVWTGKIDNLRRFKDNLDEVTNGLEFALSLKDYNDLKIDDVIECYSIL